MLPAVRALARKLDVDLSLVQGSGPGGMITRVDVERAARSLTLAHAQIVPTTVTDEVQIDAWSKDADITIRLVQAIATACKAEPSLNVWYNSELGERRQTCRRWYRCRS